MGGVRFKRRGAESEPALIARRTPRFRSSFVDSRSLPVDLDADGFATAMRIYRYRLRDACSQSRMCSRRIGAPFPGPTPLSHPSAGHAASCDCCRVRWPFLHWSSYGILHNLVESAQSTLLM